MEERIARLSRAFDAFIELSDIRAILALFDAPALVRHRSRQLLSGLAVKTDVPVVPELPGESATPDYWLAPAIRAVVALLHDADASKELASAQRLDSTRTSLLISATASLAGRRDIAGQWLPKALGELSAGKPVTRRQQLLWQQAAAGAFGPAGAAYLAQRLASCVTGLPGNFDETLAAKVDGLARSKERIALLENDDDVRDALAAAQQLAALRALCAATTDASTEGADEAGMAALGEMVRGLVDEGTAEEQPLLRRSDELRAVIENRTEPTQDGDEPVGTVEELLLADAFNTDAGPAGAIARQALRPRLTVIADKLAATAAVPMPPEISVKVSDSTVRVSAAGPNDGDVAAIRKRINGRYVTVPQFDVATWALAVVAVVVIGVGIALPKALLVLCCFIGVGLLIGAGVRVFSARSRQAENARQLTSQLEAVDRRAATTSADYETTAQRLAEVGTRAAADRDALLESIPA